MNLRCRKHEQWPLFNEKSLSERGSTHHICKMILSVYLPIRSQHCTQQFDATPLFCIMLRGRCWSLRLRKRVGELMEDGQGPRYIAMTDHMSESNTLGLFLRLSKHHGQWHVDRSGPTR